MLEKYWQVVRIRSSGFSAKSLMALSYKRDVGLPGVKCPTVGEWAVSTVRHYPDDDALGSLREILPADPSPIDEHVFVDLRNKVSDIIGSDVELYPGTQFGVPKITMRDRLRLHWTNEIVSTSLQQLFEAEGISGATFRHVDFQGTANAEVVAIAAESLSIGRDITATCPVCMYARADDINGVEFVASQVHDVFQMPFPFNGFVVSDGCRSALEQHSLNLCMDFLPVHVDIHG